MAQQTEENRTRLVLLDDHGLFRASLSRFLASEPGFEIAGECGGSAEALEVLNSSTVDLVLLDFDLGQERGNEFISAARQAGYRGRFLLVAGAADARSAAIALKLGASGIFLKSEAPERLVHAIRLVANGEVWVDPRVIQMLAEQLIDRYPQFDDQGPSGVLEDRERNVLLGILGGLTNKKIGAKMGISESSVKNIVQRLFGKAGVKTRSQLVRVALEGSLGTTRHLISRELKTQPVDQSKSTQARQMPSTSLSPARQSHG
jgi:DNA-binding NarL/FixJ family response regulator